MPKRTRLPKKSKAGNDTRLRSAIRTELRMVSDAQLKDFATASKSVIDVDSLMATYNELAIKETDRRKKERKTWGAEPPVLPSKGALVLAGAIEAPKQAVRRITDFYASVARGDLGEDVIFATDYVSDKLSEFWHHGEKAKQRWADFAKAHKLMKKSENDYIREGYQLKQRLSVTTQPSAFKRALKNYRKGYDSVVIVPTKVNGKPFYSLFAKGVR